MTTLTDTRQKATNSQIIWVLALTLQVFTGKCLCRRIKREHSAIKKQLGSNIFIISIIKWWMYNIPMTNVYIVHVQFTAVSPESLILRSELIIFWFNNSRARSQAYLNGYQILEWRSNTWMEIKYLNGDQILESRSNTWMEIKWTSNWLSGLNHSYTQIPRNPKHEH